METCVIFCAGEFDTLLQPLTGEELILAADGGLRHTRQLGLTPNGILGDFDSLGYIPEGAQVFPVEKDDTDSMLAVRHGLARGCSRFLLYGAMDGPRLDHTVANLQTLCYLAQQGAVGYLIGKDHVAAAICNARLTFPSTAKGILSVFCMGADARGVTLEGLQYPLQGGVLRSSYPLGVSNHFLGSSACVSVAEGTLLLIWERENGLGGSYERV